MALRTLDSKLSIKHLFEFHSLWRINSSCHVGFHPYPEAICEAVTRPQMRFVPIKDEHQQATLTLHRTRQGFIEERTALYNRIRRLIAEFGIVLPQKVERLRREIGPHLEDLPGWASRCVGDMLSHADRLDERIHEYDKAITEIARQDERCKRLVYFHSVTPLSAILMGFF